MIGGLSKILLSKIEVLLGDRGQKADHAVRWRDLSTVYDTAAQTARTIAASVTGGGGTSVPDNLEEYLAGLQAAVDAAANEAQSAGLAAQAVRDKHDALVEGFTGRLDTAFAAADDLARAALRQGWVADPAISEWSDGQPDATNWYSRAGLTGGIGTQFSGRYGGGIAFDVPAGSLQVNLSASSDVGLNQCDPAAPFVVVTLHVEYIAGDPAGTRLRPAWSTDGATWVYGEMHGISACVGTFAQHGIVPNPGVLQMVQVLAKRPSGSHTKLRLDVHAKASSSTSAQQMRVHLMQIRAATEAEVASGQVDGLVASASTQATTLAGLQEALAQTTTNLTASINARGRILYQTDTPGAEDRTAQALWIDTTDGKNTPKRWSGAAWVAVTDKAATDAAAAAATVAANLSNNYLTTAGTNEAIAAAKLEISASIDSVDGSVQGFQKITDALATVVDGTAVTVSLGGAALGQANTLTVVEGSTARVTGPVPNGATVTIPAARALLLGGQRIKIGVLARTAPSNSAASFGIAYSAGADGNSGYMQATGTLSSAWKWFTFYFNAPTPATGGQAYISIFGDHAKSGKGTRVARVYVEVAAVAGELPEINTLTGAITDLKALDLDALDGTALGTLLTQLDVSAGGTSAALTVQGEAIADLQGNASASYLFRAQAGSADALLELVAADDPNGTISVARIAAQNILLKGSVAMEQCVFTDLSGNLIANGAFLFGDARGWSALPTGWTVRARTTGSYGALASTPTEFVLLATPDPVSYRSIAQSDRVPCKPDDRFVWEAAIAWGTSGTGMQFRFRINWYGADGVQLSTTPGTSRDFDIPSTSWTSVQSVPVVAPAGAASAQLRVELIPGGAGVGFLTNLSCVKQRGAATLVTPNSVTTDLVDTDSFNAAGLAVFGGTLQSDNFNASNGTGWRITKAGTLNIPNAFVKNAHIDDLAVDRLKIAGNAVSTFRKASGAGGAHVNSQWTTRWSMSFTPITSRDLIFWFAGLALVKAAEGKVATLYLRLLWRGDIINEWPILQATGVGSSSTETLQISNIETFAPNGSGSGTLQLQIKASHSDGTFLGLDGSFRDIVGIIGDISK